MTLNELADRCEAATGPDRELDRDIALSLELYDDPEDLGCFEDEAEAVVRGGGQTWAPLAYTSSIDAALTLVPEGAALELHVRSGFTSVYLWPDEREDGIRGNARTLPLALCAAALRALAISK